MAVEQQQSKQQVIDDDLFSWIRINKHYFRTLPGILKILQVIVNILCLYLILPPQSNVSQWFSYVVSICIIVTVIWCFVYLLSVREAINFPINWPFSEMLNMCFLVLILIIVSIFQILHWRGAHQQPNDMKNIFAGIFGVVNCFLYLASSGILCMDWKQTHTINA